MLQPFEQGHGSCRRGDSGIPMICCMAALLLVLEVSGCAAGVKNRLGPELLASLNRGDAANAHSLIDQGADVNAADERGWTVLMFTARRGDLDLTRALLAKGARVDARNDKQQTALVVAHPSAVAILVAHGADLDVVTDGPFPETALSQADGPEKVKALLAAGARPDPAAAPGIALAAAVVRGDLSAIQALLNARADPNAWTKSYVGGPVIVAASTDATAEMMQLLIQAGGDVNLTNTRKQTALHLAARNRRRGVVDSVLARGPEIDARDDSGFTPLFLAAQKGCVDNVRSLLAAGADPNLAASDGQTAIEWAVAQADQPLVDLLRGAGARGTGEKSWTTLRREAADAQAGTLETFHTNFVTDGRIVKVRGRVRNIHAKRVEGIRYEVDLLPSDGDRILDTLYREVETTLDPNAEGVMRFDLESTYMGSEGRIRIRAVPIGLVDPSGIKLE